MPIQKDLKRLVRARMAKTGEAYTAARLQLLKKNEPVGDYAALAGMSDATVRRQTGRSWADWVRLLDGEQAAARSHRDIARYVSALGTPGWWTQTVTVGYERIRGLRAKGQQRDGGFQISKSRTFAVPIDVLYAAFASAARRRRWLRVPVSVKSATPPRRMRIAWNDDTIVQVEFAPRAAAKCAVAVQHEKLRDKSAAAAMKQAWADHFDRLGEYLS